MSENSPSTSVPFSFFVSLVEHVARIKPRKANARGPKTPHSSSSVVQTFENWVSELHRRYDPLPPGTTAIVFRFLFPEEDTKRKYDMQETRLAHTISKALCLSRKGRGERLAAWKAETAVGCLGLEVRKVIQGDETGNQLSIEEVDLLLSTLASRSPFSANCVHQHSSSAPSLKGRPRTEIIRELYSRMCASEACVVTQIILKDLRPLLYPLPEDEMHYTSLLMHYKSNALDQLSRSDAMRIWDTSGRMLASYRARACLDEAALTYEQGVRFDVPKKLPLAPKIGTPIQIPKCSKRQGCAHSLRLLRASQKVWAETKYDGERTQIHVDVSADSPRITIYSKSGRDSTMDRIAIHPIILDAIGYGSISCEVKRNVVLEAEMVAYSDALHRIDEFWRIRSLIGTTAIGPRHIGHPSKISGASQDTIEGSQCSLASNASDDGARHLALVFFDVLVLDDVSFLASPYSSRRETLEGLLHLKSGHAMLAERVAIDMCPDDHGVDPDARLRKVFAEIIADHQEGVVLKAHEAMYNDWRMPWVKLKKDYIGGYGDTLDLVLVGASWEKDRARELRVAPSVYTTFYIGALGNASDVKADPRCKPHYEVFFTASYGLSREELEHLNFRIKSSGTMLYEQGKELRGLAYTYNMFHGLPSPAVLFLEPMVAEIVGGSFTKATHSKFYELRFPRITKVYRSRERLWIDSTTLDEFQRIAREAVGHESSHKDVEDWCNELWGKPRAPGVKCPIKRKRTEAEWAEKLELADKKSGKRTRASKSGAEASRLRSHPDDSEDENSAGLFPDTPKSLRMSKALGSMTNLIQSPPPPNLNSNGMQSEPSAVVANLTPAHYLPSPPPPTDPPRHVHESPQEKETIDPLDPEPTCPSLSALERRSTSLSIETKRGSPGDPSAAHLVAAVDTRTLGFFTKSHPSAIIDFKTTCMGLFLQDAVVWLATPQNAPRPAWRVPSRDIVPIGQQVHSLEAVFQACNWVTEGCVNACNWVKKGVIFVNDATEARECGTTSWTEDPLRRLTERRTTLLRTREGMNSKPIWVFSITVLSYDVLREDRPDGSAEARALCRFG